VKNRFQSLPFKCNLQRYTAVVVVPVGSVTFRGAKTVFQSGGIGPVVGLCTLNQVDP
jgi:hypothetical protein